MTDFSDIVLTFLTHEFKAGVMDELESVDISGVVFWFVRETV